LIVFSLRRESLKLTLARTPSQGGSVITNMTTTVGQQEEA
jgi:hypothetical protein